MAVTQLPSQDSAVQSARLQYFLRWATPAIFSFSLLYAGISVALGDVLAGIISVVGFAFGVSMLMAWRLARRGAITMAVVLITSGTLCSALIFVLVLPAVFPAAVLVPLLAVALALPYFHGPSMQALTVVAGGVAITVAALGTFVNLTGGPPPWYANGVVVATIAAVVPLVLLLLWQFSSRLTETLAQVQTANDELGTLNGALSTANQQLTAQLEQQRQLIDLVSSLEMPVVTLADHVLLAPIVGHIDGRRAQYITDRLLHTASANHSRLVVMDVSGVTVVDTAVAHALIQTSRALQLLGCQVTISGISAPVAQTLIDLGIRLDSITTVRSPQEALASYQAE
jgi:rsbT co-antagonist protein RsbR